jgi:4-phytase/acid phosphatase
VLASRRETEQGAPQVSKTWMAALIAVATASLASAATAAPAGLTLERVVLVQRHGVRPPTSSNAELAPLAAQPWPTWPVPPGDLTPHGAQTVRLMGLSLGRTYRAAGVLPAHGCPAASEAFVWADGSDERTRRSGEMLAKSLEPGCALAVAWAAAKPRDPIFNGDPRNPACRLDPAAVKASFLQTFGPDGAETPATRRAESRMQAIVAPKGCNGGPGVCLSGDDQIVDTPTGPRVKGPLSVAAGLSEDLLLEYAEGMPASQVGWGRASTAADIAAVMATHERFFGLFHHDPYVADRFGAPMARLILAALAGQTSAGPPPFGPRTRLLALAGHDSNIALMGGVFGLSWSLPDEPDSTAPASTLAFELWRDRAGHRFVRALIYYETLDQLRTLSPNRARTLPLTFAGCASGPMGACPLSELTRTVLARLPAGCGDLPAEVKPTIPAA